MKPMRSFGLLCLHFYSLLLLTAHAQLNFLQKHEASEITEKPSSENNDMTSLLPYGDAFHLEQVNLRKASGVSNQEAVQSILGMENLVVLYKIRANPNSSDENKISSFNQVKEVILNGNNENIALVWEDTIPSNTMMLLDALSHIQFDLKNSFSFTHKCYKEETDFVSYGGITCIFVIKPRISMSFGRRLQEENTTTAVNNINTTTSQYNITIIKADNSTQNNTASNSTSTNTTTEIPTKDTSGTKNKPIKTDVAAVHPKSFFSSIVVVLTVGLVIAGIVVAFVKIRQKWRKQQFLTLPNKKLDIQKLIIKPSFYNQPESGLIPVSGGIGKPKRGLFLSETNNFAMSPVIDVKTIQHLNLEENHRSSMLPEEVILTNIDDGPESMDSSKTSDLSPQDIGFNIEFSMLDAQESSKFRGKNLKSEG